MNHVLGDLWFSFNTVLPVFIIVLVGYYMRKRGTVGKEFISTVSTVVFYYALPASMFKDVAQSNVMELANIRFILVTVIGTVGVFLMAWAVALLLIKDKSTLAAVVHASYRGNYVYIGLPIILSILQTDYVACSVLIFTFVLPLYNILGVFILSFYTGDMSRMNPKALILTIIKNPMILASFFGILYALTGLPLPGAAVKSLSYLGSIASPLALIMIGARMVDNELRGNGRAISIAFAFKLIIDPALMCAIAYFLGMPQEEIVSIFVLFGVPSAMNTFIMAKSMGADDGIAANIIVATVLGSIFTMTAGIFVMRLVGIV